MSVVEIPTITKKAKIYIRPYVNPQVSNMGLEKYNIPVVDGTQHSESVACLEANGTARYITGLNEFAPEVQLIQDKEKKAAVIKDIRETVATLEKLFVANIVDPEDKDFWNKVKYLRPDNHACWKDLIIRVGNEAVPLDPEKNPLDLLRLRAIEAGGFSIIAPTYEIARSAAGKYKFYRDKEENTVSTRIELTKLRNKAAAELQKLYDKNQNKLFYVCKVLDVNSAQYKRSTPNDVLYENMDKYITGQGTEPNLRKAILSFLEAANSDMEHLKMRSIIKDATFFKFIYLKGDGFIYEIDSNSMLGRNPSECIEYLKNPLNEAIFLKIMEKVEKQWNR